MTLNLEQITHSFGGNKILQNCSYQFKSGETYIIVGENGVGKSTLLNIINGLIKPKLGKIVLDGKNDITSNSVEKNYYLGIIRTWQFGEVFKNINVIDNLRVVYKQLGETLFNYLLNYRKILSQEKVITEKAETILSLFNLIDKGNELAGNLSLGEQKLLAFGRILMNKKVDEGKAIILLDEPFSGINYIYIEILSKLIKRFASNGNIVIVVEHNFQRINEIATKKLELKNMELNELEK